MSKIEFPRWIYKGKTEQKIVQNMDEYQTALAEGWRKGVIDEAEEAELDAIGEDVSSFLQAVEKVSLTVDALQLENEAPEAPAQTNFSTEGKETDKTDKTEATEETMSYRAMLEANAKKLNIKFGIKTSNSQLAAMIQRRG